MVSKYLDVISRGVINLYIAGYMGFVDTCDCVVYLQTVYSDGSIKTVLIGSKTRVALVKRQSIP